MAGIERLNFDQGCFESNPSGPDGGGSSLSASVGLGGRNIAADVRAVQTRLNAVPPASGGPTPPLNTDGLIGPKTNAAIQRFQGKQFGWADGRVDPDGPTIKRLDELAGLSADDLVKGAPANGTPGFLAGIARLAKMTASLPDAKTAVDKALACAERAFNFVALGSSGLFTDPASFAIIDRHFLFKGVGREQTLSELRFITTTFRRMKTILDNRTGIIGGPMFGENLFENHPRPQTKPKNAKALVRQKSSKLDDGITPHKIYLLPGLDGKAQDTYTHILLHELGHFIDEETADFEITDHGYAFFGTLDTLPHDKRMHNADTFAIFAFENAFGRTRLKAIFPNLK